MLLTRSPLTHPAKNKADPFDLHVLSTPPAFVLSQDQTLQKNQKQNKPATSHHHTHPNNQARTHATATHNQKNKNKPENKNSPPTTPQDPTQPPPQTTQQQPHKTPQRHRQTMAQKTSTLSRSQTTHPQETETRIVPSRPLKATGAVYAGIFSSVKPRTSDPDLVLRRLSSSHRLPNGSRMTLAPFGPADNLCCTRRRVKHRDGGGAHNAPPPPVGLSPSGSGGSGDGSRGSRAPQLRCRTASRAPPMCARRATARLRRPLRTRTTPPASSWSAATGASTSVTLTLLR